MIYICKGCGQVCVGPCKCCAEICKKIGQFFRPVLEKPLGTYVVATWVALLFIATPLGVLGMLSGGCSDVKMKGIICIICSVIHSCVAYYIQWRIVQNLAKGGGAFSGQQAAQEAGKLILYDVGFCIYMIFYFGGFGAACWSMSADCDYGVDAVSLFTFLSALCLVIWGVGAFNYALCWYFGNCLFGGANKYPSAQSGPPPGGATTMGYPQGGGFK